MPAYAGSLLCQCVLYLAEILDDGRQDVVHALEHLHPFAWSPGYGGLKLTGCQCDKPAGRSARAYPDSEFAKFGLRYPIHHASFRPNHLGAKPCQGHSLVSIMRLLDDIRQAVCYVFPVETKEAVSSHPSWNSDAKELGMHIAAARRAKGLTQAQLAERVGISRLLLSDYERGKVRVYADVLSRIAEALATSPSRFFGSTSGDDESPPPSLRLVKRIQKIEKLPLAQQKALLKNIDMFLKAAEADNRIPQN
ncbi:MAG TPA: helix-turn-helix transcriptional regulator [Spirochaetia bacterium]|nr:helix-turn-helix transcriptional regulator [Spirochaetia bacterium]